MSKEEDFFFYIKNNKIRGAIYHEN